jgi:hypothetical protein
VESATVKGTFNPVSRVSLETNPSAAKAVLDSTQFAARLKAVPFQSRPSKQMGDTTAGLIGSGATF